MNILQDEIAAALERIQEEFRLLDQPIVPAPVTRVRTVRERAIAPYYEVGDVIYNSAGEEAQILSMKEHQDDVWADWIEATNGVYGCRMALYEENWFIKIN